MATVEGVGSVVQTIGQTGQGFLQFLGSLFTNIIFMAVVFPITLALVYLFAKWNQFRKSFSVLFIAGKREVLTFQIPLTELPELNLQIKDDVYTYNLKKTEPFLIRKFWGTQPLYIVDKDTVLGIEYHPGDDLKEKYDPKVLGSLVDSEFFRGIVTATSTGNKKLDLVMLILGITVGFIACYLLANTGVITI